MSSFHSLAFAFAAIDEPQVSTRNPRVPTPSSLNHLLITPANRDDFFWFFAGLFL